MLNMWHLQFICMRDIALAVLLSLERKVIEL